MSSHRILFCLSLLLVCSVTKAATTMDKGTALLQKADSLYRMGNFEKAVEVYLQSAEEGNAEAQFDVGYAYYNGEGTSRDYTSAAMWFKRSAKQQYAKAMYNLAYCYMNGRGVPRDYDKAYAMLMESAERGYKRAQLTLADCFERGVLVEQNEAESRKWKDKAEGKSSEETKTDASAPQAKAVDKKPEPSEAAAKVESKATSCEKSVSSGNVVHEKETLEGDFNIEVSIPGDQGDKAVEATKEEPAEAAMSAENNPKEQGETSAPMPKNVILGPNELNKKVPVAAAPTLRILYPEDQSMFHTDQIKMKYQVINNGCTDSTRVVVMVDGQRQPATRAVRAANTIDVDLPHHDCTVMMYAQNSCGNSEPVTLRLIRETSQFELPKLFVVAIGVGDYNDPKLPKLRFTCKDAQDFAKAIATKFIAFCRCVLLGSVV